MWCLFLKPQGEVGPSIVSSDALYFSSLSANTAMPVWVSSFCLLSVRVVAILVDTFLFPEQCSALPVFP